MPKINNRKKIKSAIALAGIFILSYVGILAGAGRLPNPTGLFSGGETLSKKSFDYAFTIKDLDEKKIDFTEFKGKVVFLNLWATWCGPCRAEMPGIQRLHDQIAGENIVFIMLSIDPEGQQAKVKKYIAGNKFIFPVFMPSGQLPDLLNVHTIPTTFIITRDGKVATKKVGATDFDTSKFKQYLEDLAAE
jgi:thiol-disulfide isomerase/thioredoxin